MNIEKKLQRRNEGGADDLVYAGSKSNTILMGANTIRSQRGNQGGSGRGEMTSRDTL